MTLVDLWDRSCPALEVDVSLPGQRVVRVLVGNLADEPAVFADVAQHDDCAETLSCPATDRRDRNLHRNLRAVAPDQSCRLA